MAASKKSNDAVLESQVGTATVEPEPEPAQHPTPDLSQTSDDDLIAEVYSRLFAGDEDTQRKIAVGMIENVLERYLAESPTGIQDPSVPVEYEEKGGKLRALPRPPVYVHITKRTVKAVMAEIKDQMADLAHKWGCRVNAGQQDVTRRLV